MFKSIYLPVIMLVMVTAALKPDMAIAKDSVVPAPTVKELLKTDDEKEKVPASPKANVPYDRLNRSTPRSSAVALGNAINQGDYELAMEFLDMRQVPNQTAALGTELVRQLRIIADRTFWMGPENLSTDPHGHLDDGLPRYRDRVATINTPEGPVDILMQRVPGDKKGDFIWKVSNLTVANIPRLYELYGYGALGDKLSRILPEIDSFILQPWQIVILTGIVLIAFVIAWLITATINLFLKHNTSARSGRIQELMSGPVRFLILVILFRNYIYLIAPSLKLQAIFGASTLYIAVFAWLLTGLVNLFMGQLADRMIASGNENGTLILRPASRAIKGIIIILAFVIWLDNMGFKISTIVAGLGVGSIAVALAAQKSIENLIGAITLYSAQPVKVGEFCRIGTYLGTIEEIGLRATKVRTLDNTLINIPNASLSNMEIENISQRQKILYRHTVRLRSDSSTEQVREVLEKTRNMLLEHPRINPVPARVRFKHFGQYSLDLEIFAYIQTTDYNEYLQIAEELNLKVMDFIAKAGTHLALPTQLLRMGDGAAPQPDPGLVKGT